MTDNDIKEIIDSGESFIGIELGSTRIKAVIIAPDGSPLASGGFGWENSQVDGIWIYPEKEIIDGLQACYSDLKKNISDKYGCSISRIRGLGISGMMHGYLAFDKSGKLLVPFRTWRNNITQKASEELTALFNYPIPQRWSIAHLYQAILNKEKHVESIARINTLAGWIHQQLTGEFVLGIGDASGMFPIDTSTADYNAGMLERFDSNAEAFSPGWKIRGLLPEVLPAGTPAGKLTKEGALLLDPSGSLEPGIPLCPPEGDAGTGMVATNSVRRRTGNVSAGTSVFAMIVLENELSKAHHEIDLVTTPDGNLVAMAHSNNCSTEYSAWVELFGEAASLLGTEIKPDTLYDTMMQAAIKADPDCGGLLAYGYHSGEHITGFTEGRPLLVRKPGDNFTPANIIRAQLFTSLCALRTGLNILTREEGVEVDEIRGHGGFFKTEGAGERIMAAALNVPVSVLETAGEGGAWGIALLAAYADSEGTAELPDFLAGIFSSGTGSAVYPDPADVRGFDAFFERYHNGLAVERAAVDNIR